MSKRKKTGEGELMTESHKDIITTHYETLVDHLNPGPVLKKMVSERIITMTEEDEIRSENATKEDRAGALVRLLVRREDRAFDILIETCKKQAMPALAKLLEYDDDVHRFRQRLSDEDKLSEDVRTNLERQLKLSEFFANYFENSLEDNEEYNINEPIPLSRKGGKSSSVDTKELLDSLQTTSPSELGERLRIDGAAGSGKTVLLHHIAKLWINKDPRVHRRFKYVYYIPQALVGQGSIIDIIAQDLGLVSQEYVEIAKQALKERQEETLFLLDGFGEGSVQNSDIEKLIAGQLCPKSTVIW